MGITVSLKLFYFYYYDNIFGKEGFSFSPSSDCSSDFEVIGKIGSGGFGIVYLVSLNKESQRHKEGKDVFAMKVIDKVKFQFFGQVIKSMFL
jgi:hypothetical protein